MTRVALLLVVASGCFAPPREPITGRVETFELASTKVGDTFQVFVRLPPGVDATGRAPPLVVQLDANLPTFMEFDVTAGLASAREQRGRPAVMVVGVGYASGAAAQQARQRDLALPIEDPVFAATWSRAVPPGGAPAFHDFLRDELMPALEARYRIAAPSERALFGHSMGGLFVLYALTRHDEAPLFTGYVAASPSLFWDAGQALGRWGRFEGPASPALLFTAAGQLEGPEMVSYFDEFTARAEREARPGLTFASQKFAEDHVGVVTPAFLAGLDFLDAHGFGATP